MADNKIIQMQDYTGNNQYPVTLASIVYDDNGKSVSDRLAALEVLLKMFEWDGEVIKAKASFYSVGQVSASGKGEEGGGGGAAGLMLLTEWDDSITDLSSYALGANLGKGLRDEIAAMKSNPSSFITLKTINNQSLFGSGNLEVKTTVDANDIRNAVFTGTGSQFLKGDGSLDSNAYVITNARYGNIDINQIYDSSIWGLGVVTNAPYDYGAVLTMAYRKPMGNEKPDYAAQIFIPNGDQTNTSMKYRTSHADYWDSWRTVIDDSNIGSYALPLTGGTIESAGIPLTIKRANNPYSVISFYGIADGTSQHFGYLGFSGVGEPIYITSGGSERVLIHSGNVGSYALRIGVRGTSGNANEINEAGIIGFTEELANTPFWYGNLLTITTNPNYYVGQIAIQYNGTMAVRGRSASTWSDWQTVLTPSNIGNYALSYSGGKLSNSVTTLLVVDSTSGREAGIRFTLSDVSKGWVGYNTNNGVHLYSYGTGNNTLGIKDDGTPHYSGKTLIHEGNVGDYTPLRKARQSTIDLNTAANGFYEIGYTGQTLTNAPSGIANALFVDLRDSNGLAKMQFVGASNSHALFFRADQGTGDAITSDWKQIAFTDSDITGYSAGLKHSNGTIGAIVNSSGNVGIGTTNPAYKLDVAGTGRFTGLASFDAGVKIGATTLGYTNLGLSINTSLYPNVYDSLSLGHSSQRWLSIYARKAYTEEVKIGEATLTWDTASQALKVDKPFYSTSQVSSGAKAVEAKAVIAPLELTSNPIASTTTEYTDAQIASQYGLTSEVLDNLARGIYTRVVHKSITESFVWDYEVYYVGNSKTIILRNGTGSTYNSRNYKFERKTKTNGTIYWTITNA